MSSSSPVDSFENLYGKHAATPTNQGSTEKMGKARAFRDSREGVRILRDFFLNNPDEELTIEDGVKKLGLSAGTVGAYLSNLKTAGLLERVSVYRIKSK